MNNTTVKSKFFVWVNLGFVIQGLIICAANLVILVAIMRYRALRNSKEHVLMLGVSFADIMSQAGHVLIGIYQIVLVLTVSGDPPMKTVTQCMRMLHPSVLHYGFGLGQLMLLALSCDRLVCVLAPLTYVGWTVAYARRLVAFILLLKLADLLYFYSTSLGNNELVPATCAFGGIQKKISSVPYRAFFKLQSPLFALLSVLVYFVVICIHKRSSNKVHPVGHPHQEYELKRQRKVTVTLWLSALCTLFLFVLPFSIAISTVFLNNLGVGIIFYNLSNANYVASVLLYPLRHKEIVLALKAMFTCKRMPNDIRLWKDNNLVKQIQTKSRGIVPRGRLVNGTAFATPRRNAAQY